jgi:TolB-like protein
VGCVLANLRAQCKLELLGTFRLLDADGVRVELSSKKGQALIAMLAVSGGGERTRTWFQEKLWGSRSLEQAQASVRTMLSGLRAIFGKAGLTLLHSDHSRIWLDLALIDVDVRSFEAIHTHSGEFLEGLDIPDEEGFEDWLRDERSRIADLKTRSPTSQEPQAKNTADVLSLPAIKFGELPALAVLPFVNLTGDPLKDVVGEGISEDLIDRLSRLRWLPIIARSSSFGARGADLDPKTIGAQLGARYILDGRLRETGGDLQLAVFLTDTQTGQIIWSNKQIVGDGSPAVVDDLLTGFAAILGDKIDLQEQNRMLKTPQADLNVLGLIWRGRWHLNRFTQEDAVSAKNFFAKALEQEPNSPEAIIQMAQALLWDAWALRLKESKIKEVRQMAQKAIIADYDDARGHMIAGITECFLRQPIRAKALLHRAVDLNPSLVFAHVYMSSALYLSDEPAAALVSLNFAVRLSPNDQHLFHVLGELAICHYMLGDYAQALDYAEASTLRRPAYWFAHVTKINALVKTGDMESARQAYQALTDVSPHFDHSYIDWVPFCDSSWNTQLKDGLNQVAAGDDPS